jgi:transposase
MSKFQERRRARLQRVAELTALGRSTRQIADELDVDQKTVSNDQKALEEMGLQLPEHIEGADGKVHPRRKEHVRDS